MNIHMDAPLKRKRIRSSLRDELIGFSFDQDRLWSISGEDDEGSEFDCGLAEYNDEITGYSPELALLFKPYVHYGGNAYFVLNQARACGYKVYDVKDRPGDE